MAVKTNNSNKKKTVFIHFNSVTTVCDSSNGAQDIIFVTIFLEYNLAVRLHFSEIVSIGKLDNLKKDFVSLKMIGMEIGKRQFSTYLNNVC